MAQKQRKCLECCERPATEVNTLCAECLRDAVAQMKASLDAFGMTVPESELCDLILSLYVGR